MNDYDNLRAEIVSTLQCHTRLLVQEKKELKMNIERVIQEILKFFDIVKKESANERLPEIPPCIVDFIKMIMPLKPDIDFVDHDIVEKSKTVRALLANRSSNRERSGRIKPILEDLKSRTMYTLWSWRIRDS